MNVKESSDKKEIQQVINEINNLWLNKKYDEIGNHLSKDVIIAPPGLDKRIAGREAYIQSYRDYDQSAITNEYTPGEAKIDIINDTAIAICPFHVVYELKGDTYNEKGQNILVFSRLDGAWKVIWRTMHFEPAK